MTIPTRYIGCIKARQGLSFDDDVLQNLVDRMADVNIAIGIGRAVMQHELGRTLTGFANALVEFFVLPLFQPLWFTFGQIATHGESSFREIQFVFGVFIVSHLSSLKYSRACLASLAIQAFRVSTSANFISSRILCIKCTRTCLPYISC